MPEPDRRDIVGAPSEPSRRLQRQPMPNAVPPVRRAPTAPRRAGRAVALLTAAATLAAATAPRRAGEPTPFDYARGPAVGLRDSLLRRDSVDVRRVRFPSPKGGDATGLLVAPNGAPDAAAGARAGRGRYAGIVMGHGAPGQAARLEPRAVYLARHGAVVLIVDAPFVRRDPNEPLQMTPADSAEVVQQVVDYRRALDHLAARDDVDPRRLAFVGGSQSAYAGALLAGVEPRLRAAVLAMGDPGYVEHHREPDGRWNRYFPASLPAEQIAAWARALAPLDGGAWLARSAVPSILLQNARRDEAVPRHAAEALHAAAPARAERRWYDTGHRLTPPVFVDQLTFLARTLGTTPPTAADSVGPYGPPAPR